MPTIRPPTPVLLLASLAIAAASARAQVARGQLFDRTAEVLGEQFYDHAFRSAQLPALVERFRPAAQAAQSRDEERAVVHALLREVPASHLALYSAATHRRLEAELVGKALPTVGCQLVALGGRFFVDAVLDGGPAQRAGLQRGDRVLAIDGVPAGSSARLDWRADDAHLDDPPVHDLLVSAGERLLLRLERAPGSIDDVVVTAADYSALRASRSSMQVIAVGEQRFGYVHLVYVFHLQATRLVKASLDRFAGLDGVVLDLRGRGGSGLECPGIVKTLQAFRDTTGLPVAVLVDGRTRSAKEVLAYEIQRQHLGTLVGEPTAGAVLPATFAPIGDESVLMFPASTLGSYTRAIEGKPVQPDVHASDRLEHAGGKDPILQAGLQVLTAAQQPASTRRD